MLEDLDLDGLLFSSQAGYSDSGLPVPGLAELEAGGFDLNLQPSLRHFPGAFGGLCGNRAVPSTQFAALERSWPRQAGFDAPRRSFD